MSLEKVRILCGRYGLSASEAERRTGKQAGATKSTLMRNDYSLHDNAFSAAMASAPSSFFSA
jgi:hypothetical protein